MHRGVPTSRRCSGTWMQSGRLPLCHTQSCESSLSRLVAGPAAAANGAWITGGCVLYSLRRPASSTREAADDTRHTDFGAWFASFFRNNWRAIAVALVFCCCRTCWAERFGYCCVILFSVFYAFFVGDTCGIGVLADYIGLD